MTIKTLQKGYWWHMRNDEGNGALTHDFMETSLEELLSVVAEIPFRKPNDEGGGALGHDFIKTSLEKLLGVAIELHFPTPYKSLIQTPRGTPRSFVISKKKKKTGRPRALQTPPRAPYISAPYIPPVLPPLLPPRPDYDFYKIVGSALDKRGRDEWDEDWRTRRTKMGNEIYPTHTCFDDSLEIFVNLAERFGPESFRLVHAICVAPDGTEFSHAWVENIKKKYVFFVGVQSGERRPFVAGTKEYYEMYHVKEFLKYTGQQAFCLNMTHNHYGPWLERYRRLCSISRTIWR